MQVLARYIHAVSFGSARRIGIVNPINPGRNPNVHGFVRSAVDEVAHRLLEGIINVVVALYLFVGEAAVDIDVLFVYLDGGLLALPAVCERKSVFCKRYGELKFFGRRFTGHFVGKLGIQARIGGYRRAEAEHFRAGAVGIPASKVLARFFGRPVERVVAWFYRLLSQARRIVFVEEGYGVVAILLVCGRRIFTAAARVVGRARRKHRQREDNRQQKAEPFQLTCFCVSHYFLLIIDIRGEACALPDSETRPTQPHVKASIAEKIQMSIVKN